MTREEAIRHIRDLIAENNSIAPNMTVFEQEKEALYMAIEALSEPSKVDYRTDESANIGTKVNDLISRADALQVICDILKCEADADGFDTKGIDFQAEAEEWLEDVPSVSADRPTWQQYEDSLKRNIELEAKVGELSADRPITSGYIADDKEVPPYTTTSAVSADRPSVEIKECKPLCTEQKIAVEEFLNAPRITEECAIELLQMTGWLQEHDKEIGRPSGEWLYVENEPYSECSKCGRYIDDLDEDKYAYCPYCGARMKGGADNG